MCKQQQRHWWEQIILLSSFLKWHISTKLLFYEKHDQRNKFYLKSIISIQNVLFPSETEKATLNPSLNTLLTHTKSLENLTNGIFIYFLTLGSLKFFCNTSGVKSSKHSGQCFIKIHYIEFQTFCFKMLGLNYVNNLK